MSIMVIKGPANSGKSLLANSMRNTAISSGCGALMIDDHADGEAVHHLEKIIKGDKFVPGTAASDVNWKNSPKVILVNSGEDRLQEFESICPGFIALHGPISRINVGLDG